MPPLRFLEWTLTIQTPHPALLLVTGLSSFGFMAALAFLGVRLDSPWRLRNKTSSIKERKR